MTRARLLHGLGADRRAFQRFERLLPAEWDVESLDLLGHGAAPKPARHYSLDDHAAWIESRIELIAPVLLVGHSYGAATSVAVAARHSELVTGIVLLDPITRLDVSSIGSRTAAMIEAKRAGELATRVAELFPEGSTALQQWTVETWEQMSIGVVDEFDPDWMRFADRVTCPVAIVHGELELGGGGDLAADWFDEPVVVQVDGAGHYLHATHARETASAIVAACEQLNLA